ncbi:DDE-type integrase/transposase/recombinase [Nocardia sp. NPDC004750]
MNRNFTAGRENHLWCTDITEHPTREGKVYCCAVIDAYSRRIVGWAIELPSDGIAGTGRARHGHRRTLTRSDGHPQRPRRSSRIQLIVATPRSWRCGGGNWSAAEVGS